MGRIQFLERVLDPFVTFGHATPSFALSPLMEEWFSQGKLSSFMNPLLLSSPAAVARAIGHILTHGTTISAVPLSLREMYLGLVLGVAIGFTHGVFIGRFPGINNIMSPFVNVVNAIPLIIAIPLLAI